VKRSGLRHVDTSGCGNASPRRFATVRFLIKVDPLLRELRGKNRMVIRGFRSTRRAALATLGAATGSEAGIPFLSGAFDAHWDAIGVRCRSEDIVNVVGTSTCIIGIIQPCVLFPAYAGVVQGRVHPQRTGIEAGLSAVGRYFSSTSLTAPGTVCKLLPCWRTIAPDQTGLTPHTGGQWRIAQCWLNPNCFDPALPSAGISCRITAQDELFARD